MPVKQSPKLPRRSRRLLHLEPYKDPEQPSMKPCYLPVELASAILELCEKSDLKHVRLVSKDWNAAATPFLFDRVWISPREVDLEVFRNITTSSNLSRHVRRLVYDASHLDDNMTLWNYVLQLWDQIGEIIARYHSFPNTPRWLRVMDWYSEFQASELRNFASGPAGVDDLDFDGFGDEYGLKPLVREAYDNWLKVAKFERYCVQSGALFNDICIGLKHLSSLRSFVFENAMWRNHLHEAVERFDPKSPEADIVDSGPWSPLARTWHPFHLRPVAPYGNSDIAKVCFESITKALSTSQIKLVSLDSQPCLGWGFPASWLRDFQSSDDLREKAHTAYSNLQNVSLSVHMLEDESYEVPGALGIIPTLLLSMSSLKSLTLDLRSWITVNENDPTRIAPYYQSYNFAQIFPIHGSWPTLTTLSLSGISIDAWRFAYLKTKMCRKLKKLSINRIEIVNGHWEGAIQALRLANLDHFEMNPNEIYLHKGRQPFGNDPEDTFFPSITLDLAVAIVQYILHGGRHPCLPKDSPDASCWHYITHLFPPEFRKETEIHFRSENIEVPPLPPQIIDY